MVRFQVFILFLLFCSFYKSGSCQELYPIVENGKWGYINEKGKIIINCTYDKAYPFKEGYAAIFINNIGWGYIDTTGNKIIPPKFDYANNFSENLASVRLKDGTWGFINKKGKVEIKVGKKPNMVGDFNYGIAYLDYGNTCNYITKKSKKIKNFTLITREETCPDYINAMIYGKEINKGIGTYDVTGKKINDTVFYTQDKRIFRFQGKFGFCDSVTNERFTSDRYEFIHLQKGDSIAIVEDHGSYMIYNTNSKEFIAKNINEIFIHHFFSSFDRKYNGSFLHEQKKVFSVIMDKKFTYLNRKGEIVWQENKP